jgi:hypothetical protein
MGKAGYKSNILSDPEITSCLGVVRKTFQKGNTTAKTYSKINT